MLIVSALLLSLVVYVVWIAPHTPYGRLHPRLACFIKIGRIFTKFVNPATLYQFSPQLRDKRNKLELNAKRTPYTAVDKIEDALVASPTHNIPIRIYTPSNDQNLPLLLFFHGGGWYFGNLETHDAICRDLSIASNAIVIAVDYRLAPEHPYPAAIDDAYSVLCWVRENPMSLPVDVQQIGVIGDSAGANIATVLAIMARDRLQLKLAFQALIYPVTNLAHFNTESYLHFANGYGLSLQDMQFAQSLYIPNATDRTLPYASPLLTEDLSQLPDTLIITAQFDVLRDEGEAYAERLKQAGNAVQLSRYAGMIHGFIAMSRLLQQYQQAINEIAHQFHAALALQRRLR